MQSDVIWLTDILTCSLFSPNRTQPSFVKIAMESFWFPLNHLYIQPESIWAHRYVEHGNFGSMRMKISLLVTSIWTWLSVTTFVIFLLLIFAVTVDSNYQRSMHFLPLFHQGGVLNQIVFKIVTATDVDIALVTFNFCCFSFNFEIFANSDEYSSCVWHRT